MKIIETKVYEFDELSEQAKEKAREWYQQGAFDHDWYDSVYEDSENVGLKIEEFDLDRGYYVKAKFLESAESTAHLIVGNHWDQSETFIDAINFLKERNDLVKNAPKDENGEFENEYELDQSLNELESEFLKTLQEDYRIMLQKEWEWLNSNESIDENIRINQYTFTEDGKRF